MTNYQKQGKKNRAAGQRFEKKVRADLESKGWIVDKWTNNVEFEEFRGNPMKEYIGGKLSKLLPNEAYEKGPLWHKEGKLVPAKMGFYRTNQNGFPDFIAFKYNGWGCPICPGVEVIGVECKTNGYLDKTEKEKCEWLIINNIFSKILIASKGQKRGEIIYKEFFLDQKV